MHHHHMQMAIKLICWDATPKLAASIQSKESDPNTSTWEASVATIDIVKVKR